MTDVNLWLCGHAHKAQLYFSSDDASTLLMLMTGVGRKLSPTTKHRYSVYQLSVERNAIGVKVRVIDAGENSAFRDDKELLGCSRGSPYEFQYFPLSSGSTASFHRLNAESVSLQKGVFLDQEALKVFREVSLRVNVLSSRLRAEVEKHVSLLECCAIDKYGKNKRLHAYLFPADECVPYSRKDDTLRKQLTSVTRQKNILRDLLTYICANMYEVFTAPIYEAGIGNDSSYIGRDAFKRIRWRIHFRKYAGAALENFADDNDFYIACTQHGSEYCPKQTPWHGFLDVVYKTSDKLLIHSVSGVENPVSTSWSDFLSGIPTCPENELRFDRPLPTKKRPLLSYGISVGFQDLEAAKLANLILYAMDFSMLNRCVSVAMDSFLKRTGIDFKNVVVALKEVCRDER